MKTHLHRHLFVSAVSAALLSLGLSGSAHATQGTWGLTATGAANWNVNGNWANGAFPNAIGDTAVLNTALTGAEPITLGANITLGSLTVGATTAFSYSFVGGNPFTMNNGGLGATITENSTMVGNNDTITSGIVIADTGGLKIANVSASALTVNGGITSTSLTPNLTVQANSTGNITFGGTINNAGTITNSGTGTGTVTISNAFGANVTGVTQNSATSALLLSANNPSFTGPVVVQNGTLELNSQPSPAGTGTITLGNSSTQSTGAAILVGQVNITEAISLGTGATANGGTLTIGNYLNNDPTFSSAVTLNGNNLTLASFGTGGFGISGGITGTGNITIAEGSAARAVSIVTNAVNNSGTITNTGTGTSTSTISSVGSNVTGITENSTTSALTVTALAVNSTATTLTNSSGTKALTVNGGVTGTGNLILNNNSATNGGITLTTVSVNNKGSITNSGSGAGTVTITTPIGANVTGINQNSATSTLILSGASTNATPITVTAGTLQAGVNAIAGVSGAFGLNSAVTMANTAGATLNLANDAVQIGSLSGGGTTGGNVTLGTATLTFTGTGAATSYAGVISGTGGVAANSTSGSQALAGVNTYSGATTVSQGSLIAGANALGNVSTSGTWTTASTSITGLTSTAGLVVGESITGTGIPTGTTITGITGNSITLSKTTTAAGTGGALTVGQFGAFGDSQSGGNITLGTATAGAGGASILTNGAYTVGRNIVEATTPANTSLSIGGNQTSGTSTYTGNITLTGATTLTSATGGEVDFTTGVISGAQNVIVNGGGLVKLTGANTFGTATAGSVTVTGGTTLNLGNAVTTGALGAAPNILAFNNGTFQFTAGTPFDLSTARTVALNAGGGTIDTNGNAVTFANAIGNNGTGALTLNDSSATPGSLTLAGSNTYTGGTVVNRGTIILSSSGTLGGTSGALTVNTNGNLNLNGTSQTVGNLTGSGGAIYNNGGGMSTLTVGTGNATGGNYTGAIQDSTSSNGTTAVTKNGTGTITLSGVNTYSGATNVNGGTLAIGAGGSLGGTAVTLSGGNFQVGALNSSAATVLGTTGAGSLTIGNGGSLTFANGVANATSNAADVLDINNSLAGSTALTLNDQGSISIGIGGATGSDEIVLGSGLLASITGSTTINLNVISALNGTTQELIAWGATPTGGGTFAIGTVNGLGAGGYTLSLISTSAGLFLTESAVTNAYWKGGQDSSWTTGLPGGSSNFTTDAGGVTNRAAALDASTSVIFNAAGGANYANTTLDGSPTINSLTFNVGGVGISSGNGGPQTLTIAASGSGVTVAAGLGAVTETISSNVEIGNTQTWTVNDAASTLVVSGNISGDGNGLIKAGNGTLQLSGTNSYSGATSILAGNIDLQSADALDGTSGVSVSSGAALQLQGGFTTTNATSLTLNGAGASGGGALENLSGDNTYTGTITLGSSASIGADAGSTLNLIANNLNTSSAFTLTLVGAGNGYISSSIAAGALTMNGTGIWTIDGNNFYAGPTTVNSGTLQLGGFGTFGNGNNPLIVNGGVVDLNGSTLTVGSLTGTGGAITNNNSAEVFLIDSSSGNGTYAGSITDGDAGAGVVDFQKEGSGVTTLSGVNTYTGGTFIEGGALNLANNGALGTGPTTSTSSVSVSNGAALQLSGGITTAAAVPVSLSGAGLASSPNGALENVSGNNTFTGPITLLGDASIGSDAGTLILSPTATIGGSGNLTFTGMGNGSIASVIGSGISSVTVNSTGTWTPTVNTTGTWTLSGANAYTGPTSVINGTLAYTSGSVLAHTSSINLGSTTANTTAALTYKGSGETVANALNFTGNQTVVLGNSGTGAIVYSATPNMSGAGNINIVLGNATDTLGGSIGSITNGSSGVTTVTKTGAANSTWVLTGTNSYTGNTNINGGVLQVASGTTFTNLVLNSTVSNAILQTSGTLNLTTGTNLNWGSGGGFSAIGGTLNLNINNGAQLVWVTNIAGQGASSLAFGSSTSNAQVILSNAISLGTTDLFQRSIYVEKGAGGDSTLLSGALSNGTGTGAASGLNKIGGGTLILSNSNSSYSGLTSIVGGTLVAEGNSPTAGLNTTGVFGSGYGPSTGTSATEATISLGADGQGGMTTGGVINPTLMIGGNYTVTNSISVNWTNGTNQIFGVGGYLDAYSTFSGLITLSGADTTGNTFAVTQVATTGTDALNLTGGITATNGGNINFANVGAVNVNTTGISNGGASAVSVSQTGSGTTTMGVANTYTGGTTISAGTFYANGGMAGTSSATGTGAVAVTGGATLGGSGVIRPGAGLGITLAGSGVTAGTVATLISGGAQPAIGFNGASTQVAGPGLTLDNTVAQGIILNAAALGSTIPAANLTLYLGAGTNGLTGSTVGQPALTFSNPNLSSTYLSVLGNTAGELSFASGDTITALDLTGGNLQLNLQVPYLLIQAGSNADYTGLSTTGGTVGGVIQNGYVTNLVLTMGAGTAASEYSGAQLYLYNGDLELTDNLQLVPEPGTWAMLLGGFALLVLVQRRKYGRS